MFNKKGFTLVELMIVVAIIGILAAIAVPNFISMQLKAKRAEVPGNVDGIKTAALAYDAAFDGYISAASAPRSLAALDKTQVAWTSAPGFDEMGWSPDGEVRGAYSVDVNAGPPETFQVNGACDVDADGTPANYTATGTLGATLDSADTSVY